MADLLAIKHLWPSIAKDIALLTVPGGGTHYTADDIAKTYGLTADEFADLTRLPAFETFVKDELARIKSLGPNAGARMRAEAMAVSMQEQMFQQACAGVMDEKVQLQFLNTLLKSAGLDQPPENARAAAPQSVVNVAFSIPRLPTNRKLSHLTARSQTVVVEGAS